MFTTSTLNVDNGKKILVNKFKITILSPHFAGKMTAASWSQATFAALWIFTMLVSKRDEKESSWWTMFLQVKCWSRSKVPPRKAYSSHSMDYKLPRLTSTMTVMQLGIPLRLSLSLILRPTARVRSIGKEQAMRSLISPAPIYAWFPMQVN